MKNMECLKCCYEWEGFIGDCCPRCGASCDDCCDKREKLNE